jgi:hypothetical protein
MRRRWLAGLAVIALGACGADGSGSVTDVDTSSVIAVDVDNVYIAGDRRSLVVEAGADESGACMSIDAGARAEVVDGVLVVDARREVAAAGPPATCPGICTVLRSVVPLDEPLDAGVSRFRSVVGAVSTCSSAGVTGVDRAILQCAGDLSALVSSEGAGETAGVATTQPTPGSTQPTC